MRARNVASSSNEHVWPHSDTGLVVKLAALGRAALRSSTCALLAPQRQEDQIKMNRFAQALKTYLKPFVLATHETGRFTAQPAGGQDRCSVGRRSGNDVLRLGYLQSAASELCT